MKLTKFATALLIAGMGVSFAASAKSDCVCSSFND